MPLKNGVETVTELKQYYKDLAQTYDRGSTMESFIEEPVYVFLSAHNSNKAFVQFCKTKGVDHFFEKPLQSSSVKQLLRLVQAPR